MLNEVYTSVEEGMFNTETKSGNPEIFLRPKETVTVPFKFLSFKANHSVQPQVNCINPFSVGTDFRRQILTNVDPHIEKVIMLITSMPILARLSFVSIWILHTYSKLWVARHNLWVKK